MFLFVLFDQDDGTLSTNYVQIYLLICNHYFLKQIYKHVMELTVVNNCQQIISFSIKLRE